MTGAKLEPGTVKLRVLIHTRQLQLIFPEKKNHGKRKPNYFVTWSTTPSCHVMYCGRCGRWRIVTIGCCVAWYFNLRHVNDYSQHVRALTKISTKNKKNHSSKCKHDLDVQKNQSNYYSKFVKFFDAIKVWLALFYIIILLGVKMPWPFYRFCAPLSKIFAPQDDY